MDIFGNVFWYLRYIRNGFIKRFWTILIKIYGLLNHITIGRKTNFSGLTRIVRTPHSKIQIGSKCSFKSYEGSNLVGINRRCILFTMTKSANLYIGNNCGFSGTVISCSEKVTIKDNVLCGANVLITDTNWHPTDPNERTSKKLEGKEIIIEENAWIGANSYILKGVTIGKNSIIGIGSIVTKNIPANCVAAGNPCKIIRHLDE